MPPQWRPPSPARFVLFNRATITGRMNAATYSATQPTTKTIACPLTNKEDPGPEEDTKKISHCTCWEPFIASEAIEFLKHCNRIWYGVNGGGTKRGRSRDGRGCRVTGCRRRRQRGDIRYRGLTSSFQHNDRVQRLGRRQCARRLLRPRKPFIITYSLSQINRVQI